MRWGGGGGPIGPGDWVTARVRIPVTFTDSLLGDGIRAGTRGVVTNRSGGVVTVDFDSGFGTATVTTKVSNCTLARRDGGVESFRRRARVVTTIRVALAVFLLWPFALFLVTYLWHERTLNGIEATLVEATLDSAGEWVGTLLAEPVRALVYLAFLAVLSRIAFR